MRLTADFVQRFAELGNLMDISTDPAAFDSVARRLLASQENEVCALSGMWTFSNGWKNSHGVNTAAYITAESY